MQLNLSGFPGGLLNLERLDVQRVMRWIVNLIACCCGLLAGAMLWKVYTLVVDKGVEVPDFTQLSPPALENPGWGSWLDLAQSVPPQQQAVQPKKPVSPAAKPIDTRIDLVGIIGYGNSGVAIMRVNDVGQSVYSQGDLVEDGVTLKRIEIEGVVLSNGETEKGYYFPQIRGILGDFQPDTTGLLKPSSVAPAAKQPESLKRKQLQPAQRKPAKRVRPQPAIAPETKKQIEELRQQPMNASRHAEAQLVRENGQLGLRIGQLHNPQLFQAIGLSSNDIVISVNGISVDAMVKDPVGAQAMLKESKFRIEILRNGVRQFVDFAWPK